MGAAIGIPMGKVLSQWEQVFFFGKGSATLRQAQCKIFANYTNFHQKNNLQ